MTEPLVVDPSRLKAAGITLQDLTFPAPPPPASVAGADSVSAAINETLPVIESPVISGLPALRAAVERTGSSIVAAARIYAETDQALGGHVSKTEFPVAGEKQSGRTFTDQPVRATADQPPADESTDTSEPTPPVEQVPGQPNRFTDIVGAMGTVTQNAQALMSTVQGAMGGMGNTSASTAQAADDAATAGQSPSDQTELVDDVAKSEDERREPDTLAGGASTGDASSAPVPVQPPTGTPETAKAQRNP